MQRTMSHTSHISVSNLQSLFSDDQDKKADLCIHTYVDDVMRMLMARLELDIPEYDPVFDPVKQVANPTLVILLLTQIFDR